jgi:hypothetical protein
MAAAVLVHRRSTPIALDGHHAAGEDWDKRMAASMKNTSFIIFRSNR